MEGVLHRFCGESGQKVNMGKSKLFFSSNMAVDVAAQLSSAVCILVTDDLGVYSGIPSLLKPVS